MNPSYRIVWVDDSPDWVDSVKGDVVEYLRDLGYEPDITLLEDGNGVLDQCKLADVDLIIIDYHLRGKNGDAIISEIRGSGSFTEIVFYSQSLLDKSAFDAMDGVFLCQRPDAVERIQRIIDLTLHKLNDLGVVRGLIIAAAIDLEVMIEELVVLVFDEKGPIFRNRILDKRYLDFEKKATLLTGAVKDQIQGCGDDKERKRKLEEVKGVLNDFCKDVVDNRNILAHSCCVKKEGQIVLEGINTRTKKIDFNADWLSGVRTLLRKHRENLRAIEHLLDNRATGTSASVSS
jgi:CheY-like chemotaxis protein